VNGSLVLSLALTCLFSICASSAQDNRFPVLAKQIITTSVKVKPGDVVVVSGGKHTIPLMEEIAIEAAKAGGMVQMFLNTDRFARAVNAEVPEQYLSEQPRYLADWIKDVDVWISLPDTEDYAATIAGVPEQRLTALDKAGEVVTSSLNTGKVRLLSVNFPSKADADLFKIPFADLETMHWNAVDADYQHIWDQGNTLKQMLATAKEVRITSAKGTDLRFSPGGREAIVDAGIVTEEKSKSKVFLTRTVALPGGTVSFAPLETSGRGKVFSLRERCRPDVQLLNAVFDVQDGKITNFHAQSGGDCYEKLMAGYTGPKDLLGSVSIGLNPAMKVSEDYRPQAAAGMVWINFGNNELLGGSNKEAGGFPFAVTEATVEVDGKTVVKDGRLVF
jgi:aminopeptidase